MPSQNHGIRFGPLGANVVHVCVDMQRLFAEDTPWRTPWMERVLPKAVALVETHPAQTVFTRFVPAMHPGDGAGVWRRYWERWADVTIERLGSELVELVPQLAHFIPPARVVDKASVYSPWLSPEFESTLGDLKAEALVISGGETDICVLATVLGAVDRGYRTVVVTDALCSSTDETHDALMTLYAQRYGQQVETATTAEVLSAWRRPG
jgi:nicotinamidase-related amidase